jgi:hypothetical protein
MNQAPLEKELGASFNRPSNMRASLVNGDFREGAHSLPSIDHPFRAPETISAPIAQLLIHQPVDRGLNPFVLQVAKPD